MTADSDPRHPPLHDRSAATARPSSPNSARPTANGASPASAATASRSRQIDASYDVFKRFFALPEEVKRKYHVPGSGGARGYTPFGVETAKDSKYFDLKEFWHVGREIPRDSKYADVMPPNLWPEEIPEFREQAYGLYEALDQLGSRVLSALALHIGLPENYFADKTDFGNSILRPIHYPPITTDDIPNVRAGAHEDINLITLLVGASAAGLEVQFAQGRVGAVHRRRRHHRGQHRRHAAAPDQPRVPVDHAPRGQSAGREGAPAALLDAVLPAPEPGFPDRRAAVCITPTIRTAIRKRSPRTAT